MQFSKQTNVYVDLGPLFRRSTNPKGRHTLPVSTARYVRAVFTYVEKWILAVLPATHMCIHKWNEPCLPLLPSRRASPHSGRYSFPVPLRVGGWVGVGGWGELPARRRSPIPVFVAAAVNWTRDRRVASPAPWPLVVRRLERNAGERFAGAGLGGRLRRRRRRLDDDVGRDDDGDERRRRAAATPDPARPQRHPARRAPRQPVRGAPERPARHAVQQEVGGEVDVEELLDDLLNENEQAPGHVRRVDVRPQEDVDANGVTGNVEQQEHSRHQEQHLRHLPDSTRCHCDLRLWSSLDFSIRSAPLNYTVKSTSAPLTDARGASASSDFTAPNKISLAVAH